jgi:hypothetical protein
MREITPKQDGKTMCIPEQSCEKINKWLNTLPKIQKPSNVPFENGLYFFYEEGETSEHAPQGRIVRVGNHPLSQGSLKRRLRMHYSGGKKRQRFQETSRRSNHTESRSKQPLLEARTRTRALGKTRSAYM